ncbi:hypothetical protein KIN20_022127 [Parelaphostrongylus tenuis]|uniref:Uncharacterized protein n=1 Tax=Parelaphostrongylus tenuis TaxID=148309 RepID=A0AAD5MV22_PARTN|nr:hypothetical protein KIN20_022127 [Parelaphostrongylus tenuis]
MLYRNRSNVPLRPFSKRMDELKRWNRKYFQQCQVLIYLKFSDIGTLADKRRLERMLKLSLPDSKFGSDDRVNTPCNTVSFEEFVYDLSQAGPSRRNLLSPDLSQGQEVFPVQVYSDTPNCDPPGKFACISSNDFSSYGEPEDNEGIALGNPQRTGLISL